MKPELNPFLTIGYISKEYFCDRENELTDLHKIIKNSNNITLISARRLGKSALIYRFFDDLESENIICIYIDIFAATCLKDLTEMLALTIFNKFPQKKGFGRRFFEFLKGFRPVITYDALTGQPEIHFDFVQPKEYEYTLRNLLQFLDAQEQQIVLAIDEFQQIAFFPEKNIEALLRTIIQTLKNTQFIFCGSKKHLMLEMFNSAKRPFFSSTQMLGLSEIPTEKYKPFIIEKFAGHNRQIDEEAVEFILSWTLSHTYYTQIICNAVFAENKKKITLAQVKLICEEQLTRQQINFIQYRDLLAPVQWKLLIAIAKEGLVFEPHSQFFLQKHKVGAASSVQKALNALLDKEMLCTVEKPEKTGYRVYDVFLMRWLERKF